MSFQSDIYDSLVSSFDVSSIVGDRVFFTVADGSTATPYLVFQIVTTGGETAHDSTNNLSFPTFQVTAWADGGADAISAAKAARDALDGSQILGSSDLTVVFDDQRSTHDSSTNLFGEVIDFRGHCNRN